MKHFIDKLRHIYIPVLIASVLFVVLYTLLHWYLVIDLKLFSPKEDLVQFWLPMGLPWIIILVWISPRIKQLQLATKRGGSWASMYYGVVWFAMAIPTIVAQFYLQTATGKLTVLDNINTINKSPATRYYKVKDLYIDRSYACVYGSTEVSGRYNEDLDLYLHIALPIFASADDTAGTECAAWLGKKYHETISNDQSDAEKDKKWEEFATRSEKELNEADLTEFAYLENEGNTNDHDKYNKAIARTPRYTSASNMVLRAETEPFEARNGEKLGWVFRSYAICMLLLLVMLIRPKMSDTAVKDDSDMSAKEFFSLFVLAKGYAATPIIMDLNIIVFLCMVVKGLGFVSFHADDLLYWGANYGPATMGGQWWRLLSSAFLHSGIMHLVANMYGLLFAGMFLEPIIGSRRFTIIYLVTGILASVTSMWWHVAVVSVGASGAIFGIYGALLILLVKGIFPTAASKGLLISAGIFVGYNLLMGMAGNTDNAAHIGGLISGILAGLLFYPTLKAEKERMEHEKQRDLIDDTGDI
ncbi:rhomboid family intramembrane serine protease [Nemorincola caseinilytica]|uniref:Rhomboid family intramembrane serine protease n=1 Tax=Nemorincola caseinilytica TaxID=2054315 RepID=A0ABP8N3P9_9BACT